MEKNHLENNVIGLHSHEFFQIRALCDEIMSHLCQAKALLEPINDEDFFNRFDGEVLRHYFYALDTIIDRALDAKDEIYRIVEKWAKQGKKIRK